MCPECLTPGSLNITLSLELPPDSRSDEITLQVVECSHCEFRGVAIYEESRRGALDSESWQHDGYRVALGDLQALIHTMRQCPEPSKPGCPCPAHQHLGRHGATGRWAGLSDTELHGMFPMQRVTE